ncbi:MAG TPA: chemotaxis protein CheB [Terriglobales bacterium]|nr:chemotaxis protein CheB [Terriglobales bacterium]
MKKPAQSDPAKKKSAKQRSVVATAGKEVAPDSATKPRQFPIVGIGASAGGLEAFSELLRHLPEKTGMAFVLVQHLDPTHGSVLQEILARTTKIPVTEVADGVAVEPDHIYVIPANTDMATTNGVLHLAVRRLTRGQHMPIDHFFHSLADDRGDQAIGVILSGTASDGTEGCTAIKAAGGITFAQDEKSAKYDSMPKSAIHAGCIDFVLPPKGIAQELARIGRHPYVARVPLSEEDSAQIAASTHLETLFAMIREATGVDFAYYKQTTLQRRIKRRMVLHQLESLKQYVRYVRENPAELDELYREILIHVTGFFRDEGAFEALRKHVFPDLFKERKHDPLPIRIWVPGCSTGEEVYSIAMILLEYMWEQGRTIPLASASAKSVQIFATDISDTALDRARAGLYTDAGVAEISPERLKRFFVRLDGGYQINKAVRDMCIFAKQNLVRDPPFSNLDLISCRNLLIYLGPVLQKRVIPALHYALKAGGYLMLGGSESLGGFTEHFSLTDKKYKIYKKKMTSSRLVTYFTAADYSPRRLEEYRPPKSNGTAISIDKEVERTLASRYIPPSIVVNEDLEIIQFRGRTGAYLEPAAGHPTFSLSKMAREGLLVDLRTALSKAKKENTVVRKEGVHVRSNGGTTEVNLEIVPIQGRESGERMFAVVFQDVAREVRKPVEKRISEKEARKKSGVVQQNERLQREINQLREQLQALIEEHETTTEEFKAANEEVLSANEELQSTNEELETAKEELQSSNEELTTLNEELQNRNVELSLANNDLLNLLANVNIAVVMVGNDLRIRRITPPAEKLMNLIPADIGRRLDEIKPNVQLENLEEVVRDTMDRAILRESEIRDKQGIWYAMRVRPYKTWDSKIDGAVISFQDIDALKRTLDQTRSLAQNLIENARESVLLMDASLRVTVANPSFYHTFQVSPEETEGRLIYELGNGQWNIPKLRELLVNMLQSEEQVQDFEVSHEFPTLGYRVMLLNARSIEPQPQRDRILLSIQDITEQRRQLDDLKRQAALLEMAREAILRRDLEGKIRFWNSGAEELYGWKKMEVLGKKTHEILQTRFPRPFEEIQTELLRTGHWEGELIHTRRDGEHRTVDSRWAILGASDGHEILEINTDITLRRRSEDSLRQLSARLIRLQDEERRRIARDLHDSAGQKLAAAKMSLDTLLKDSPKPERKTALQSSTNLVDEALQELRTVAHLLHPPLLDEAGLVSATRWLVDGFSKRSGLEVELVTPAKLDRLPEDIEIALFRTVQEALNNIRRHSGAKTARVQIASKGQGVWLEISDTGKGLPPEMLSAPGANPRVGVGILGMRERLAQLGGTLEISSSKKGTTVKAFVPISEKS